MGDVSELSALRSLGRGGLAALLRLRPDLMEPRPPASLRELHARLRHPVVTVTALRRLDLATLQVLQVLCALATMDGPDRGRAPLRTRALRLLGVEPGSPAAAAVDRAVDDLRARGLLMDAPASDGRAGDGEDGDRPTAVVRQVWPSPLGLAPGVRTLADESTVEGLRQALTRLGRPAAGRKAELVGRLAETLADGDFVREVVVAETRPDFTAELVDVASGRKALDRFAWGSTAWRSSWNRPDPLTGDDPVRRPLDWAMARFLLVGSPDGYGVRMPAEVALALRGAGWTAAFSPAPPALAWTPRPVAATRSAALAAASTAVRALDAVLSTAGRRPPTPLRAGGVGVRELRRLASDTGLASGEARLCLDLAHHLGLLAVDEPGYVPTSAFDGWRRRPAARRYADALRAWSQLSRCAALEPTAAWDPRSSDDGSRAARAAVLAVLAEHPGHASASAPGLEDRLLWQLPLLTSTTLTGASGTAGRATEEHRQLVRSVLTEAAWLGVTAADALSPAGVALAAGEDVAAVIGDGLGGTRSSALLQADLTATVLGEPDPDLATTLDLVADREGRSTASVWRFTPAAVRHALDAGHTAEDLLARLADLSDGVVPQPLEYLLRDVGRRHGATRGRAVACYLRSDDRALLAEIVADRRLRTLGLRAIAPTAAVGSRPWARTLEALRAAGYAPVEEDADGGTVVAVVPEHRATVDDDGSGQHPRQPRSTNLPAARDESGDTDAGTDAGTDPGTDAGARADRPDLDAIAGALLSAQDAPAGALLDIGATVIEIRHRDDLFSATR